MYECIYHCSVPNPEWFQGMIKVKEMLCILTCSCNKMFQDVHVCGMFSKVTFISFNDSSTQDWLTLLWKRDSQGVIPCVYGVLISHIWENVCMKVAKDHRSKFMKFHRIWGRRKKLDIIGSLESMIYNWWSLSDTIVI